MGVHKSIETIISYLPITVKSLMAKLTAEQKESINEVRVRVNRPIVLEMNDKKYFLSRSGSVTMDINSQGLYITDFSEIQSIVKALSRYSLHSCERELTQGYFTIENGIRVGISGVYSESEKSRLKYINSLNFRVSREVWGCSTELYTRLFKNSTPSVLICGGVNSGKTTILRDMCRLAGNEMKTALIDERNEISSVVNGIPINDVGVHTDILSGCSRETGINNAVRSLSPRIIVCDEIGEEHDADAIVKAKGCGAEFISTIHVSDYESLNRRYISKKLLNSGVFDYAVILEGESSPGKVREIRRLKL